MYTYMADDHVYGCYIHKRAHIMGYVHSTELSVGGVVPMDQCGIATILTVGVA